MVINRFHLVLGLVTTLGIAYLACDYAGLVSEPVQGLSGSIRIDGRPVMKGTVLFVSLDDEKPGAYGGYIRDGRYEVPAEMGMPRALYQVEFSSIGDDELKNAMEARNRDEGRRSDKDSGEVGDEEAEVVVTEQLPARYNVHSPVKIDLTSGNVLEADFNLE